jgi:hypothetical protein
MIAAVEACGDLIVSIVLLMVSLQCELDAQNAAEFVTRLRMRFNLEGT